MATSRGLLRRPGAAIGVSPPGPRAARTNRFGDRLHSQLHRPVTDRVIMAVRVATTGRLAPVGVVGGFGHHSRTGDRPRRCAFLGRRDTFESGAADRHSSAQRRVQQAAAAQFPLLRRQSKRLDHQPRGRRCAGGPAIRRRRHPAGADRRAVAGGLFGLHAVGQRAADDRLSGHYAAVVDRGRSSFRAPCGRSIWTTANWSIS